MFTLTKVDVWVHETLLDGPVSYVTVQIFVLFNRPVRLPRTVHFDPGPFTMDLTQKSFNLTLDRCYQVDHHQQERWKVF